MNSSYLVSILLGASLLSPLTALAAPTADPSLPRDVPARHWAAGSVHRLSQQKIMGRDPDGRFRGDLPVTRYELAVTLDRFVRYIEAARKPLHAEVVSPAPKVAAQAPQAAQQAIRHLTSNGFLSSNSSIVTRSGKGNVTAAELSDALAAVTIRLSDRAEPVNK
jgi:hypothetical protein